MKKSSKKLRIGVIGAGGMGQGLINSLKNKMPIEGVELGALTENNPKKLELAAAKFDIAERFTDHREMLAKADLNAVYIATPNFLHKQHAIDSANAGCHVFCEKPVALCAADAAAMLKKAQQKKRVFMVNFPMRFSRSAILLKDMISAGEFGDVYYVKAGYLRRQGVPGRGGWFTNSKLSGGGPMIDLGVHILDRAYWLMGAPEPLSVSATTFKHLIGDSDWADWPPRETRIGDNYGNKVDVEDLTTAMIRFKNGAGLALEASWAGHCRVGQSFELLGTKAGALENSEGLRIFKSRAKTTLDIVPDISNITVVSAFRHFIDCIRTRRRPMATPSEIMNVCKIIEAVYRSAALKREIRF